MISSRRIDPTVKQAGIKEFRDHATQYLGGSEPVEVTNHGRTVGFYIPVRAERDAEARQAMTRLGDTVRRIMAETGLSEDELAHELADFKS